MELLFAPTLVCRIAGAGWTKSQESFWAASLSCPKDAAEFVPTTAGTRPTRTQPLRGATSMLQFPGFPLMVIAPGVSGKPKMYAGCFGEKDRTTHETAGVGTSCRTDPSDQVRYGAPMAVEPRVTFPSANIENPGAVSDILNFEGESGATLNPTVCSMFELLKILRSSSGAANERNSEPSDSMPSFRNFTTSWNGDFP